MTISDRRHTPRLARRLGDDPSQDHSGRRQALRLYNGWRVVQALFLFGLALTVALRPAPLAAGILPWAWALAIGYLGFALAYLFWQQSRGWYRSSEALLTLLADIAVIVLLAHALGAAGAGIQLLLAITVTAATVLLTGRLALFVAAMASVALLADFVLVSIAADEVRQSATQIGLLGAVLFAVALVGNYLARKAEASATLAERRGVDLANLAVVNELVVTHLKSGVLLLDGEDRIRLCNIAAHHALGGAVKAGEALRLRCPSLQRLLELWRSGEGADRTPRSLVSGAPPVLPRFVAVGGGEDATQGGGATLVFLDDTSELSRQAEQMTLSSLGKLGASIAHEIRNPLGAISHAAQLLNESDRLDPADKRLGEIIHSHSRRVNELVENVLSLSRRRAANPEPVDLMGLLDDFRSRWLAEHPKDNATMAVEASSHPPPVLVDRSHLLQVLEALAENALAHGCSEDGCCSLLLRVDHDADSAQTRLRVFDNGPGIPDEMREQIFQPFFTTSHGGSGLGLYIVSGLCQANQIHVRYRNQGDEHFFELVFPPRAAWADGKSNKEAMSD